MSGEDKRFPVSDIKYERLREQGVVLLTTDIFHAALFLGVLIGAVIFYKGLAIELLETSKDVFTSAAANALSGDSSPGGLEMVAFGQNMREFARLFFLVVSAFVLPYLLIIVLAGFLQTRWLFRPSLISLDFSPLIGFARFAPAEVSARFLFAFSYLVRLVAYFAILALVLRFVFLERSSFESLSLFPGSFSKGLSASNNELSYSWFETRPEALGEVVQIALSIALSSVLSFLALSLFFAVGYRFIDVFSFRRKHMMTRAEVEEEMRELEQSNEFREARDAVLQDE